MADRMTVAELFTAMVAALTAAFNGSTFAVWEGPPAATALPAVWPEFDGSFTGPGRSAGGTVAVRCVAAIAPKIHAAEYADLFDAHDRLDMITVADIGLELSSRSAVLETIQIGGVDHTALAYTLTAGRSLPC
jgi:hypothetical protein